LQAELGYDENTATGNIGPGTTENIYSVSQGASGNYVKIIQYGLYVNGFYQDGAFEGIFSEYMGVQVLKFRQFMILPSYTEVADKTVIIGLLSSAGYTLRSADGADTSTQLTQSQMFLTDNLYGRVSDFAGWAGDLMTCWGETKKAGVQIQQGVYLLVGAKGGGTFSLVDLYQDVDAVNIFELSKLDSDETALASLAKYYVQGECMNRFGKFISNRFGKKSQIKIKTQELLADNGGVDILGSGIIAYFIKKIVNPILNTNFNYHTDFVGDEEEIATGFANKLIDFMNSEG
jgi:hypothetical protein